MSVRTRPLIGINCDYVNPSKSNPALVRVHAGYFDAMSTAGALPLILPTVGKEAEIDALLDRIDGIVLTGGLDMDPRRLGLPTHASVQPMPERRENHDRVLVRRVIERRIPVLAIGLGMQQLNAATGGTLFLHIPHDCPRAMPHFDTSGGPHRHMAMIEPNTRLEEIYGTNELRVNSEHHQAVDSVGPKMRIAAKAPDGVIEAIEAESAEWFCMGVQWHPEADTASALDMQLFECFVQAAVRNAQPLSAAA